MGDLRLNRVIGALEQGLPAFLSFVKPDIEQAISFAGSANDGVIAEMEHFPWDLATLRHFLQYLLDRRAIAEAGSIVPALMPMVRIPPNGGELNQWFAKQLLDLGYYGIVWPHVSSAEQAYNAVAACRYPRRDTDALYEPAGIRGDGPSLACRYWGLTQQAYYQKADVWPLQPDGEILVIVMIEDLVGIAALDEILSSVPGIGAVLIGEGDISQELGYPRQYEHPAVKEAVREAVAACKRHGIPAGHPHVTAKNAQEVLDAGFRLLLTKPVLRFEALEAARECAGRRGGME